jgi:two-component system, OmpR family, alkaline phosphatase synthesis response regulator PhoP
MKEKSVLLVDDDEDILEFLEYNFKKENFIVYTANEGISAIKIAREKNPSVIILDIMMNGMDGIQVCEKLNEMKAEITGKKMFLTARGEDFSQIAGFDSGADDFVVKPVNPKVLIKRVEALLRRDGDNANLSEGEGKQKVCNLIIDKEQHIVYRDNKPVLLPKKEFVLLELLASKPGKVFSREEIFDKVWGDSFVGDRTIDVHIRKLREKLGDDLIVTLKGVGYKLEVNC